MFFGKRLLHMMHDHCGKFHMDIFNVIHLVEVGLSAADTHLFDMQHFYYSAVLIKPMSTVYTPTLPLHT